MTLDPSNTDAFDRLPPHSIEAEMALIGSMALAGDERSVVAQVIGIVDRGMFFQVDHQILFDAMCSLYKAGKPFDAIILREELVRQHILEEIGGIGYLAQILGSVPSYAHAMHYAGIVRDKSLLRQLISLSNDALRDAYAPRGGKEPEEIITEFQKRAGRIISTGKSSEVHDLGTVARDVLRMCKSGEVVRIPSGIESLDKVIGGLRRGGKNLIGGKPGMGKSLLLKQILRNVATTGVPVGLITIEENRFKVGENALSSLSGVPNNRIAFGTASEQDFVELDAAIEKLDGIKFYIVDSARKLSRITAMAHVLSSQYGCQVIGVDHLHIIGTDLSEQNRERQISEISAELKWVWKDLNVAGIEAAQLNRKSGRERPGLDSLRDSGSLEQDGDVILLLHREDYYRRTEHKPDQPVPELDGILEVIVAKNKDGASGTVTLDFDDATQTVKDRDEIDVFAPNVKPHRQDSMANYI